MSLTGILLGLINIAIVVAILLLVGAVILWFCSWAGLAVPANVQKCYIAVVALTALYMIVALLLGIPTIRIIQHSGPPLGGELYAPPSIIANGARP